jgi:hypothetical protein
MAVIAAHEAILGIVKGATWGTEVEVTSRLRVQSLTINDSYAPRITQNHDKSYMPGTIKRGRRSVSGSFSVDCSFGGEWLVLYALFAGTASTPAEQNASQNDYLSNLDFASTHQYFLSLAFKIEDDVVMSVKSAKISGFSFSGSENGGLFCTVQFIGDAVQTGGETSIAELDALTFEDNEEVVIFNGSAAYFRYGDYSTGTALSSSDDVNMTQFSINLSRPITPYYGLRGANTDETYEPYSSGLASGNFSFTLAAIDDSVIDLFAKLEANTQGMAEIFVDGVQIGTGANTSLKFQLPSCRPLSVSGYGIGGQATLQQPSLTCALEADVTAPSGMSGVTDLMRLVTIDGRATAYTA